MPASDTAPITKGNCGGNVLFDHTAGFINDNGAVIFDSFLKITARCCIKGIAFV